ncbi:unnamed protein product [Tuber melanosporum]|uniref:(Perigord truffle) hypothetical protein n=1 Tax=Tuber melanosporum (strain Mel28) TaxID=656061 RepID=D5GKU4_TUBMM|nr:uncharacterized protein GSTUM_00009773001 [Tuber melanosporum]CAZ85137.1 unnamed protein product [Tuber melanosporum]
MNSLALRRLASSRISQVASLQTRSFHATRSAAKIFASEPLRAKEASPHVSSKYPVVDHEYDAIVVGAGGI